MSKINVYQEKKGELILKFPYNRFLLKEIKKLDRARWVPERKYWTIADNIINREALSSLIDVSHFARYKNAYERVVTERPLYEHQRQMLSFALDRKTCYLAATMGVGKTLTVIELMERVGGYWYYVAPKSALLSVRHDMAKWDMLPVNIKFLSYEGLVKDLKTATVAPKGVIFDEAHKLKTPTSQRTEAAIHLTNSMRAEVEDPYIILMSGTPAPKNPLDWWSQLQIAQPGFIKEGNWYKFRNRLAETEIMEGDDSDNTRSYTVIKEWKELEIHGLRNQIQNRLCVFVDKKECLDLPNKIYIEKELSVSNTVKNQMNFLLSSSATVIEALNKCRQLSDGFIYYKDKMLENKVNPKIDMLTELLEGKSRIVIFAGFTASIDLIDKHLNKQGWKVIRMDGRGLRGNLDDFYSKPSRGDAPVAFLAHPKSGGTGLTLTASDTIVYYSNDFDGEGRMQSEDRIHRPGMGESATIIDLIHLPTDKYVLDKLKNKEKLQAVTMADMKLDLLKIEKLGGKL